MGDPLAFKDVTQTTLRVGAAGAIRGLAGLFRRKKVAGAVLGPSGMAGVLAEYTSSGPRVRLAGDEKSMLECFGAADSLKVSIPRSLFLVKELLLPARDTDELEGMIPFELTDLFPVDADELTWDWQTIEVTEEGYTRVRVAATETRELEERLQPTMSLEHTALSVEPSTVSLANLYSAVNGGWPESCVAIVAAWQDGLDFAVLGPQGVVFDRGVQFDRSAGEGALMSEVVSSLAIFSESSRAADVSKIVVWSTGDPASMANDLQRLTGIAAEIGNTGALIDMEQRVDAASAAALGAAVGSLRADGVKLSLVPPERRQTEQRNRRAASAILTASLVVLALGFAYGALSFRAARLKAHVASLEAYVAEIAPEAGQIDAKRQRLAAIERQLSGRNKVLDVLTELYRVTPRDISLISLELDQNGLLTLKGHAQEMYRASEYAEVLERSEVFGRQAQAGPAAFQRTEGGRTFISFTIMRDLSEVN